MFTENLSTLKIHKLTQEQYDRELAAGNIEDYALYLTPDEEIDIATQSADGLMSAADKTKLDNIKAPIKTAITISSSASDWIGVISTQYGNIYNAQIIDIPEVYEDEMGQLIYVAPSVASFNAYENAGIKCVMQGNGYLIFAADVIPSEDLTVYVVIQEV